MVSLIILIATGALCLFASNDSAIANVFDLLPFRNDESGESFYDYRAWIAVGVLLNTMITLGVEKIIIRAI